MGKKHLSERNLGFETLQLHVGQEEADPVTDARALPAEKKCRFPVRNRFLFFRNLPALPPKRRMETGSQRLGRIVASFQPDLSGFPGTAEKENTKVERTGMAHVLPDQNGSSPFYCRHAPLLHEPGDFDAPRTPVPENHR